MQDAAANHERTSAGDPGERPPAPEHVQTYLSLARLYVREGRRPDARAVLEAGLGSHPGNEALQAEIERLGGG